MVTVNGLINEVLAAAAAIDSAVVYVLAAALMAVETSVLIGVLVPADAAMMRAGTGATDPVRFAGIVTAATGGALAGESLGYLLGEARCPDPLRPAGSAAW